MKKVISLEDMYLLINYCGSPNYGVLPSDIYEEDSFDDMDASEITELEETSLVMNYKGERIIVVPFCDYDDTGNRTGFELRAFVAGERRYGMKFAKNVPTWDEVLAEIKRQKKRYISEFELDEFKNIMKLPPFKDWKWK